KKKEMWMGGLTPLGYATQDRKLVAVPEEAETVRLIFRRYEELGSVRLLIAELLRQFQQPDLRSDNLLLLGHLVVSVPPKGGSRSQLRVRTAPRPPARFGNQQRPSD